MLAVLYEAYVPEEKSLAPVLRQSGLATFRTVIWEKIHSYITKLDCSVVILHSPNPTHSPISMVSRLRKVSKVPIVAVSKNGHVKDIVNTLDAGADECIPLSTQTAEILLKVSSVIKRCDQRNQDDIFRFGSISINLEKKTVSVFGVWIPLTNTEYKVLELFAKENTDMLCRYKIGQGIYGNSGINININTIHKHVEGIRKKIRLCTGQESILTQVTRSTVCFRLV